MFIIEPAHDKINKMTCAPSEDSGQPGHMPRLIVLGFNDMSTLVGNFVSSPREMEKRDRRDSRGDKREGQGRKEQE